VSLCNALADGQPHARTFILAPSVQSLEWYKYTIEILLINPNPIIFHDEAAQGRWFRHILRHVVPLDGGGDGDLGRNAVAVKLKPIANQILEQLADLGRIGLDGG
jgi:hypothetical protein